MYYVYLLRCEGGSLYTGVTTDPARRLAEHQGRGSRGAKYTRAHRPLEMVRCFPVEDRSTALRLERAIKRLSHAQKEALASSGADPAGLLPG